jgi:asparagine synthase (glutamine-hydrolysing)
MSVQAGIWNFDGEPAQRGLLAKMSIATAAYGPDGETTYFDGPVGMLYRPLHTTSESRLEQQPHISSSGRVITWDGRLDNCDELVPHLADLSQTESTDLAIVSAAFDRWGTDCLTKLIGDWALSIWDPSRKELILARDYAGVRHLFYHPRSNGVSWCSYLAPLAVVGAPLSLCEEYFVGYLALWPDAHLTPYAQIQSVPPGHFLCIRNGLFNAHQHWTFNPRGRIRYKADAEYEEHFRSVFRQAVRRRLRTDSPILADLSGGLDSSSIICMADDILAKGEATIISLDTFSFFDRGEPDEEDLFYFPKVEEQRGRIGHHAELHGVGDSLSFKYQDFIATPGFTMREEVKAAQSKVIRQGNYRVLLSGTGGDEMLGQALEPRVQLADLLRHASVRELAKELTAWSMLLRRPSVQLLLEVFALFLPASIRAPLTSTANTESWVSSGFARKYKMRARQLDAVEGSWSWPPSVRDSFQTLTTLARQMTQMSPSAYERRYPYLDRTLTDFLISVPTDQFLRPGQRRSLMRRALVDLLPSDILSRRTKSGVGRCFIVTLQKHWAELEDVLRSLLISRLGYVDQTRFRESLMEMKHGNLSPYFLRLLKGLSWELWLRDVVARGVISVGPIGSGVGVS